MKDVVAKYQVLENAIRQRDSLITQRTTLQQQRQSAVAGLTDIAPQIDDAIAQVQAARVALRAEIDSDI